MLGIKLNPRDEDRLNRVARETGRPKSAIAREWIVNRLDREETDRKIAVATALDAGERRAVADRAGEAAIGAWLRWLDAEDGGYEWGPGGPPAP